MDGLLFEVLTHRFDWVSTIIGLVVGIGVRQLFVRHQVDERRANVQAIEEFYRRHPRSGTGADSGAMRYIHRCEHREAEARLRTLWAPVLPEELNQLQREKDERDLLRQLGNHPDYRRAPRRWPRLRSPR